MLEDAADAVEVQRKVMLEQARADAEDTRRRWHETIRREQDEFLRELRQRAGEHVYAVTRRALADLADADLELQMIDVFLKQLAALDDETRRQIVRYAQESDLPVMVHSAFALPDHQRRAIADALHINEDGPRVEFEIRPDLTAGIEITSPSRRVAWHLTHYLDHLEAEMTTLVATQANLDLVDEMPEAAGDGREEATKDEQEQEPTNELA
ncbi:MAG: hypothetical protein R2873_31160 [Caldilineaceae bacterium]